MRASPSMHGQLRNCFQRQIRENRSMNGIPTALPQTNIYGVFIGEINPQTAQSFSNRLAWATQLSDQNKHLHLLFQSAGGSIADGVTLYNLIAASPIDI